MAGALRWAQIAGQAVTVLGAQFRLGGTLLITPLLAVIGVGLISNLAIELYFFGDRRRGVALPRPVHEWLYAPQRRADLVRERKIRATDPGVLDQILAPMLEDDRTLVILRDRTS